MAPDQAVPPPTRGDEPEAPSGPDRWLRPFFADPALRPVALTGGLVLATFAAGLLLMALREGRLAAWVALVVAAWASAEPISADLRRRRIGLASGAILGLWAAAAAIAAGAVGLGLF